MARIGNFARDVKLVIDRNLSAEARQKLAAREARRILSEAQATNARVLGEAPQHRQIVDGRVGAPLESVNPDRGKIVFEFSLVGPVLEWIDEQLVLNSPVLTGRYRDSHVLLADGVEVDVDAGEKVPKAEVYTFTNVQPYARKIERGLSDQAPDGVFEVVADTARRRFGNIANIRFSYRSLYIPTGRTKDERAAERDSRNPAIVVVPR